MKTEEIIKAIKQGDDSHFGLLLEEYHCLLYSLVNRYYNDYCQSVYGRDDLYQEACLALHTAAQSFNFEMKAKFSTYAYMLIKRRLLKLVEREARHTSHIAYSLDALENVDHLSFNTYSQSDDDFTEEFFCKAKAYLRTLNEEDLKIVKMRLKELSYREIAEQLGIEVKRVDNRLLSIRKKYQSYMQAYL